MLALLLTLFSSPNFTADEETTTVAENARWRSAMYWTGEPLPGNWARPCPISVRATDSAGGGTTRFYLDRGEVTGWSMAVEGRREAVVESVIPHEVDHMVRATLVRKPIVRWLDEGSAALFESSAEHARLRTQALMFARTRRSPNFLSASQYPTSSTEMAELYAVGFSLTEYLLKRDGPRSLLALQSADQSFEQALWQTHKLSSQELIANWRADLLSNPSATCADVGCEFHGPTEHTVGCNLTSCRAENRLIVWTASWCGACRQFWHDMRSDGQFRLAVESRFHIHIADVDRYPLHARRHRIQALPTFATATGRIEGYQGKSWLLEQLGIGGSISRSTGPTQPAPSPRSNSPEAVQTESEQPPAAVEPTPTSREPEPVDREVDPPACPMPPHETVYKFLGIALTAAEWLGVAGAATGPLGIGLAVLSLWRRRRSTRTSQNTGRPAEVPSTGTPHQPPDLQPTHAPFPRELDEARELLRLRQREGRVAGLDAIRGMVVDDELDRLAANGHAECAAQLKRQLE